MQKQALRLLFLIIVLIPQLAFSQILAPNTDFSDTVRYSGADSLFVFNADSELELYKKMKIFLLDLNLRNNFVRKGAENLARFKMESFKSKLNRIIGNTLTDKNDRAITINK